MKIRKLNMIEFWLVWVLLVSIDFFHLFSLTRFTGVKTDDILLVSSALILGYYFFASDIKKKYLRGAILFVMPVVMSIISSVVSSVKFGQSFMDGFLAQRFFWFPFLLYFPLNKAILNGRLTLNRVNDIISKIAFVEILIVFFQCILYNYVRFSLIEFVGTFRGGSWTNRLYFNAPIVIYALFLWISNILRQRHTRTSVIGVAMSIAVLFVFGKTRMQMLGVMIVLAYIILKCKMSTKKKILLIMASFLAGLILACSSIFDFIISIFAETVSGTGTALIRNEGRELYINALKKSPLVGFGYPHQNCYAAIEAAGINRRIYLVDNGIFGWGYVYGLIGVIWFLVFHIKPFILANNNKDSRFLAISSYYLYNLVIIISLVYLNQYFIWCTLMVLLSLFANVLKNTEVDKCITHQF